MSRKVPRGFAENRPRLSPVYFLFAKDFTRIRYHTLLHYYLSRSLPGTAQDLDRRSTIDTAPRYQRQLQSLELEARFLLVLITQLLAWLAWP